MRAADRLVSERRIIEILGDGQFHTGESLGLALGVSRGAVWKKVQKLERCGLEIDRIRGGGYRLRGGCELLDEGLLRNECFPWASGVTVLDVAESTNSCAMAEAMSGGMHGQVILAEAQLAGRGRRGKAWQSPFAANLYMSYVWEFDGGISAIQGMSLVVGLAVCRLIESLGASDIAVKWPNDIVSQGRKCGGILIELGGEAGGKGVAVIGIGLNVCMPEGAGKCIDQPWTDMQQLIGQRVSRNQVAVGLVRCLRIALDEFSRSGFSTFEDEWRRLDYLNGQSVVLDSGPVRVAGIAMGVTRTGSLLLRSEAGLREYSAGEVSVGRLL